MAGGTAVIHWTTRVVAAAAVGAVVIVHLAQETPAAAPAISATLPLVSPGQALLRSVRVGANPVLLAVDGQTHHVFVVLRGPVQAGYVASGPGSIAILDTRTGAVLRRVHIGVDPVAIAIDAHTRRVFVLTDGPLNITGSGLPAGPTRLSILDAGTGAIVRTATLAALGGTAQALAVDTRANRVFAAGANGVLTMLDATTGSVLRSENTRGQSTGADSQRQPTGIVIDEQTERVFVANGGTYAAMASSASTGYYPGSMSLLNASSGQLLATLHLAAPVSALALDGPARRVVVAEATSLGGDAGGIVEVLDATSGALLWNSFVASLTTWRLGGAGVAVAVDSGVHHAFMVVEPGGYLQEYYGYSPWLAVLDTRTGRSVSSSYLPGSRRLSSFYDSDLTASLVMDEKRRHILLAFQPWQPFWTGDVLYGPPKGLGILAVYDTRSGRLLRNIRLGNGAVAMAFDSRSDHVFVSNEGDGSVGMFDAARL